MKQVIITIAALTVGTGAAILLLLRSTKRKVRKPSMTFMELYEDNRCSDYGLFD